MTTTAICQLTFPEVFWSNIILTTRGSQVLCRKKPLCAATYTKLNLIAK